VKKMRHASPAKSAFPSTMPIAKPIRSGNPVQRIVAVN
jgi:hypothetical protein